jgi:hypothetical protein
LFTFHFSQTKIKSATLTRRFMMTSTLAKVEL